MELNGIANDASDKSSQLRRCIKNVSGIVDEAIKKVSSSIDGAMKEVGKAIKRNGSQAGVTVSALKRKLQDMLNK